jgi:hypothetical protein
LSLASFGKTKNKICAKACFTRLIKSGFHVNASLADTTKIPLAWRELNLPN